VLCEQRQQAVVGVLADSPLRRRGVVVEGRVVEDPEQHRRIGRELALEPVRRQLEAECNAAHHGAPHREPAPPCGSGEPHRDLSFGLRSSEELPGGGVHVGEQHRLDAVSDDPEDSQPATCTVDLSTHRLGGLTVVSTAQQGTDVDQHEFAANVRPSV
jgi:hypothetical protein